MMKFKFAFLSFLLLILFLANLFFGAIDIEPLSVWKTLTGGVVDRTISFVIMESRLPQALTALGAGASLGVSGLLLQTSFRNSLAGPSILGISSGASLGVAIVMLLMGGSAGFAGFAAGGNAAIVAGALIGSISIIGILLFFSTLVRSNLLLLISGIMIGYLTSSIVTLLSSLTTAQSLQGYVIWGMGTFGDVAGSQLGWFWSMTIIGLILSFLLAKPLNLLLLGDSYAGNLGVDVSKVRNMLLLSTGLLTAVTTAYCGPVGFIGMAVPHLSRMVMKSSNHLVLIPATILTGGNVALACNVASTLPENMVIPINALTPIVGVPVILYVIIQRRN